MQIRVRGLAPSPLNKPQTPYFLLYCFLSAHSLTGQTRLAALTLTAGLQHQCFFFKRRAHFAYLQHDMHSTSRADYREIWIKCTSSPSAWIHRCGVISSTTRSGRWIVEEMASILFQMPSCRADCRGFLFCFPVSVWTGSILDRCRCPWIAVCFSSCVLGFGRERRALARCISTSEALADR
ncbi:hypothetical protein HDK77DRAFT_282386 [Phyllosticta capitalensis]